MSNFPRRESKKRAALLAALKLHGNNFGGFYFGVVIDALAREGFRVIVPDQIGYGKSSKAIAPARA
jgi:pimeloyl-ACP methyl ester carboxylesterase